MNSRCKGKKKRELFTETARVAEKPILSYLVQVMSLYSGGPQRKTWDPHWQSRKWLNDDFFFFKYKERAGHSAPLYGLC